MTDQRVQGTVRQCNHQDTCDEGRNGDPQEDEAKRYWKIPGVFAQDPHNKDDVSLEFILAKIFFNWRAGKFLQSCACVYGNDLATVIDNGNFLSRSRHMFMRHAKQAPPPTLTCFKVSIGAGE